MKIKDQQIQIKRTKIKKFHLNTEQQEALNFLEKVNKGFKLIAKEKNWKVISASKNKNSITNEIKETLFKNFSKIRND